MKRVRKDYRWISLLGGSDSWRQIMWSEGQLDPSDRSESAMNGIHLWAVGCYAAEVYGRGEMDGRENCACRWAGWVVFGFCACFQSGMGRWTGCQRVTMARGEVWEQMVSGWSRWSCDFSIIILWGRQLVGFELHSWLLNRWFWTGEAQGRLEFVPSSRVLCFPYSFIITFWLTVWFFYLFLSFFLLIVVRHRFFNF